MAEGLRYTKLSMHYRLEHIVLEHLLNDRAIGIFDSGLGGLTAVRALRALLPQENIAYFADTGRNPYGGRAAAQLRRMARQDLDFVSSLSVKAILAACGTVSSTAPDLLESYPVRTFGVLRSAIEEMCRVPGDGALAVIATEASIRAGSFKRELAARCPGREVIALPCPEFVPLIESGHTERGDALLCRAVEAALAPLRGRGVAALLLGCTHYGLIDGAIGDFLGGGVALVSAADCAAREIRDYIVAAGATGGSGELRCYTSGSASEFEAAASAFLGGAEVRAQTVPVMEVEDL